MPLNLGDLLLGAACALLAAALKVLYELALDTRALRGAVLGEGNLPGIAARVEQLATQSTTQGQQLAALHVRMDAQDARLDRIEQELDTLKGDDR